MTFMMVDKVEEETPRTRGRPRKRIQKAQQIPGDVHLSNFPIMSISVSSHILAALFSNNGTVPLQVYFVLLANLLSFTTVRKSTRGKKVSTEDGREEEKEAADVLPSTLLDASSSLDRKLSILQGDGQPQVQETDVGTVNQAGIEAADAGQELQPECLENQTQDGCSEEAEEKDGQSRADIKGTMIKNGPRLPFSVLNKESASLIKSEV